jgi:hypothetical protein
MLSIFCFPSYETKVTIGTYDGNYTFLLDGTFYGSSPEDATSVIQSAFNYRGYIEILPGIYNISREIRIYSGTYVNGSGLGKTILQLANNMRTEQSITCIDGQDISISSITIDGRSDLFLKAGSKYGIFASSCHSFTLKEVSVMNMYGHGVAFDNSYNITFNNVTVNNNEGDGIWFNRCSSVTVTNALSINNGKHGVNFAGSLKDISANNIQTYNNGLRSLMGCGITVQQTQTPLPSLSSKVKHIETFNMKTNIKNSVLTDDYRAGLCIFGNSFNITIDNLVVRTNNRCVTGVDYKTLYKNNVSINSSICILNGNSYSVILDPQSMKLIPYSISTSTIETTVKQDSSDYNVTATDVLWVLISLSSAMMLLQCYLYKMIRRFWRVKFEDVKTEIKSLRNLSCRSPIEIRIHDETTKPTNQPIHVRPDIPIFKLDV